MRLIIVSGLSGSGKSVALHMLEDLDFYCVDNIPAALLKPLISHNLRGPESTYARTAVGIDARNRPNEIATIPAMVQELRRSGIARTHRHPCEMDRLHHRPEGVAHRLVAAARALQRRASQLEVPFAHVGLSESARYMRLLCGQPGLTCALEHALEVGHQRIGGGAVANAECAHHERTNLEL